MAGPADAAELIDIYGEDDFNRGGEDGGFVGRAEASDLYDDVLTGTMSQDRLLREEATSSNKAQPMKVENKPAILYTYSGARSKRLAVYVGNFSWWTTDTDLINVANRIGVKDIQEIKFAENRTNGQSRGYAEVVVASESSLQRLLESLPHSHINGEKVDCRFATRQNFSLFESQAKKRVPQRSNSRESDFTDGRPPGSSPEHQPHAPHQHPHPHPHQHQHQHPHPPQQPPQHPSKPPSLPPPFYGRPLPYGGDMHPHPHPHPHFNHPPPPIPPPLLPHMYPPPPPHMPSQPAPTLHLNPAFFPPAQESYSSTAYSRNSRDADAPTPPMPEGEYEELMNRNRTIASSAITKAVTGATAGDFPLAIETLLTAIAVIKQSRVSSDERCRALVTSLKDCLFSIESKSYGSRSERKRHRSRDRDRERDRDRHGERERDREREREGSHSQAWEMEAGGGGGGGGGRGGGGGTSRRHRDRSASGERERIRDRERERHREYRERHR